MDIDSFIETLNYLPAEERHKLSESLKQEQVYEALAFDEEKITKEKLKEIYPFLENHPFIDNVLLYDKRQHQLGKSLLFEAGAFYLFEPCSPLVSYFLNPAEDDLVLDLAAAPGGKSIEASFLMHNKGLIVSNEISRERCLTLSSNSEKYGRVNMLIINEDSETLEKRFDDTFSKIILDAPCSGSGMFRKENKMLDDWSLEKVKRLSSLQKELILRAYSMLKEGGEMVYSTCSYSYEEDEEVISYLLANSDAELIALPHIEGEYRSDLKEAIHLLPHRYHGEGHFIAKIRKPGTLIKEYPYLKGNGKLPYEGNIHYQVIKQEDNYYFLSHLIDVKRLHVLRYGVKIGRYDSKRGMIYDHNFGRYDFDLLERVELNEKQTLDYIYGLTVNEDVSDGYKLLTYHHIPFAIGKVSKGVIKNHYPKGLRKKIA